MKKRLAAGLLILLLLSGCGKGGDSEAPKGNTGSGLTIENHGIEDPEAVSVKDYEKEYQSQLKQMSEEQRLDCLLQYANDMLVCQTEDGHGQFPYVTFHAAHPEDVKQAASNPLGMTMYVLEVRYDGGPWQTAVFDTVTSLLASGDDWHPIPNRSDGKAIVVDATAIELRMRYEWYLAADWLPAHEAVVSKLTNASPWSNILAINADAWSSASAWAAPELERADKAGLIPDVLKGQDLTEDITRAEFAALSVRLYEVMCGNTVAPAMQNPFTDTADPEILKAYALGITKGTTATAFRPNLLISREQVATMLTRTVQAAKPQLVLDTTGVTPFADDALISDFARQSVYFMAKSGIIKGFSGNKFGPKNTTAAEEAAGYANATREQSLVIAMRSLETLH